MSCRFDAKRLIRFVWGSCQNPDNKVLKASMDEFLKHPPYVDVYSPYYMDSRVKVIEGSRIPNDNLIFQHSYAKLYEFQFLMTPCLVGFQEGHTTGNINSYEEG